MNEFYYKDVVRFLKYPSIHKLLTKNTSFLIDDFTAEIGKENYIFITEKQLEVMLKNTDVAVKNTLCSVFKPYTTIHNF